jgi:alpha-beta hydrolase superfamily lysophospholipase
MALSLFRSEKIPGGAGHLAARLWPASQARAGVVIAHGLDSSMQSEKLTSLAQGVCEAGMTALQFDHMGSGASPGEVRQTTLSTRRDDFLAAVNWLEQSQPGLPLMYIGSSMGGAAALLAAAVKMPAAMVVWVAPLDLDDAWQRLLKGPYPPDMPQMAPDRPKHNMPGILSRISHTLFIFAQNDDVVLAERNARLASDFALDPKQVLIVPGADHVFSGAQDRKQLISQSIDWLNRFADV